MAQAAAAGGSAAPAVEEVWRLTSERATLAHELEEVKRQLGESTVAREALVTDREVLQSQLARAKIVVSPEGSLDVSDMEAKLTEAQYEREELDKAFSVRMEQVQRCLSAKTIEAESLRQQLAEAVTGGESPASGGTGAARGGDLEAQNKHLQHRIKDVEEESSTMIGHLRAHVEFLMREVQELKEMKSVSK